MQPTLNRAIAKHCHIIIAIGRKEAYHRRIDVQQPGCLLRDALQRAIEIQACGDGSTGKREECGIFESAMRRHIDCRCAASALHRAQTFFDIEHAHRKQTREVRADEPVIARDGEDPSHLTAHGIVNRHSGAREIGPAVAKMLGR